MCISRKFKKKLFVDKFCVPKLYTLKFLTQKESTVMQISAASPPNFHSGKNFVKKISVYFLAICANFPCKTEKFESEFVCGYFWDRILLSGQPLTCLKENHS